MDFLTGQIILRSDKNSASIYKMFRDKYGIKYHDLFVNAAALGFVHDMKKELKDRNSGIELRSTYLNNTQKATIYSIVLNDSENGKQIEKFEVKENILKYSKLIEEYAEGGLEVLISKVFKSKWNGLSLDDDYEDYDIDILSFYLSFQNDVPF